MGELVDTLGEARVRVKFNPSQNNTVDQIKQKTAELINIIDGVGRHGPYEVARCAIIAQDKYEEAAMWAVKAATGSQ